MSGKVHSFRRVEAAVPPIPPSDRRVKWRLRKCFPSFIHFPPLTVAICCTLFSNRGITRESLTESLPPSFNGIIARCRRDFKAGYVTPLRLIHRVRAFVLMSALKRSRRFATTPHNSNLLRSLCLRINPGHSNEPRPPPHSPRYQLLPGRSTNVNNPDRARPSRRTEDSHLRLVSALHTQPMISSAESSLQPWSQTRASEPAIRLQAFQSRASSHLSILISLPISLSHPSCYS